MPLPSDLQALPLYVAERWNSRRWDLETDVPALLPWFRLGNLPFWWLLLIYAYLTASRIAGPWAGRLAVGFMACEPNLLALAAIGGSDLAISATLLMFLYHFRFFRDRSWCLRVGVPMLCYGLCLMSKASAVMFGAVCLIVSELDWLYLHRSDPCLAVPRLRPNGFRGDVRRFVSDSLQIGFGGLVIILVLCGCDWEPEPSFVAWAHQLPEGSGRETMVWLADHLRIFSNGAEALVRQVKHNMHGHSMYLLGVGNDHSIWYYFPVLLTIKLPVPLLYLPIILLCFRPRTLLNAPFLVAVALLR